MGQLIQELKRRNVIRVAVAYAVAAWLLIQVADALFPMLRLPEWAATFVAVLLLIGFPIALIFAWAFELTPEGIKLEKHVVRDDSITHVTGRKLDFVIIATLVVALGYFGYDKFVLDPGRDAELVQSTTEAVTEQAAEPRNSEIPEKSIAVLPFRNRSSAAEDAYFVDGIHDDILTQLSKLSSMDKVISRTSMEQYRDTTKTMPQIGEELGVATILEGGVQRSGDRVRVNMQLIDARADKHLWADTYDRELTAENLFAIQSEISREVAAALQVVLTDQENGRLQTLPTTNLEAYKLLLKSRVPARRFTKEGLEEASRLLIQALAIDPEYAAAWSELASVQVNEVWSGTVTSDEGYARAEASAQRALTLDPENARAMAVLGVLEMYWRWDFEEAGKWLNKAREVAPGDSLPLNALAIWTSNLGRAEAALALYQEAVDRDPLSHAALGNLAMANIESGRFDPTSARLQLEKMKQIAPDSIRIPVLAGLLEWRLGNFEEALRHANQLEKPYTKHRACALHSLGRFAEAQAELEGYQQRDPTPGAFEVADVYGCWGDKNKAFEWLERAYEEHDSRLITLRSSDVTFEKLHDDPRWEALLQKLRLSDEHAEKLAL